MQTCSAFNAVMPTLAIPLACECFGARSEVLGFFLVIHPFIGTVGLSEQSMRSRAQLYAGDMHVINATKDGTRIVIRLADKVPA